MIEKSVEIIIADSAEREHLFVEAWLDEEHFGELFIESSKPMVTIFNHLKDNNWTIDYQVLKSIVRAFDEFLDDMNDN